VVKKEAYAFLYRLAEGIAGMFGRNCETVVQEIEEGEIVTLAIFNGHVSGRRPMSQIGILGGKIAKEDINYKDIITDVHNQLVIHPSGKKIKSSSFFYTGADYEFVLGINYDVTLFEKAGNILEDLLTFEGDLYNTLQKESGNTLDNILNAGLKTINFTGVKMSKKERGTLIFILKERNFFEIQKSVPFLAEKLGVSKYTIYKDLNALTDV